MFLFPYGWSLLYFPHPGLSNLHAKGAEGFLNHNRLAQFSYLHETLDILSSGGDSWLESAFLSMYRAIAGKQHWP